MASAYPAAIEALDGLSETDRERLCRAVVQFIEEHGEASRAGLLADWLDVYRLHHETFSSSIDDMKIAVEGIVRLQKQGLLEIYTNLWTAVLSFSDAVSEAGESSS